MEGSKRILFVNSEIYPYLPESNIGLVGRYLPQAIQEAGNEIRSFMPRYGCINERRNQLHEVIRLSGMNIVIGNVDQPLVIKVASISAARMQVYFIDNEDYFRRKQIDRDENGQFFADNGERAIFFARGVLETVKKLRWAPDIIHCSGWITHVLPLYLKKAYNEDPIFTQSKVVLSLYDDSTPEKLSAGFDQTILLGDIGPGDVSVLTPEASGIELAKLAAQYSDGIILGAPDVNPALVEHAKGTGLPLLPFDEASLSDGSYMDKYNAFYDKLLA